MLFSNTTYHLSPSIPPETFDLVQHILDTNGATSTNDTERLQDVDVVITNTPCFEGWQAFKDLQQRESGDNTAGRRKAGGDSWGYTEDGKEDGEKKERWTVTPKWVERSAVLGKVQPPQYYSPDPTLFFSGVVACATELPPVDLEVLSGGIIALGGQWRTGLTKEVTHLFAIRARPPVDENAPPGTSTKYATALHFQAQTGVKVVLPHWFDDCVRLGISADTLDTKPYEWPNPPYLTNGSLSLLHLIKPPNEHEKQRKKAGNIERDPLKKSVYESSVKLTPNGEKRNLDVTAFSVGLPPLNPSTNVQAPTTTARSATTGQTKDVWHGKSFLLSRTLKLAGGRRQAVEASIRRAGGTIERFEGDEDAWYDVDGEEEEVVDEDRGGRVQGLVEPTQAKPTISNTEKQRRARNERDLERREAETIKSGTVDVYVTRWREGRGYVQAHQGSRTTIGTLAWVYHVQSTGVFTRPMDQLLHYPIPRGKIGGFEHHEITVTNYTGEAREYLKKLIITMGARFTPSMSARNTVLVAATKDSTKALKALSWSIPVVNHTWLEDCFIQWRNLTPATEKYIMFPPGVDFSGVLGVRGVLGGGPAVSAHSERKTKIEEEVDAMREMYAEEDAYDHSHPLPPSPARDDGDGDVSMDVDANDTSKPMEVDDENGYGAELSVPQATAGSAIDREEVDEVQALVEEEITEAEADVEIVDVSPRKKRADAAEERRKEREKELEREREREKEARKKSSPTRPPTTAKSTSPEKHPGRGSSTVKPSSPTKPLSSRPVEKVKEGRRGVDISDNEEDEEVEVVQTKAKAKSASKSPAKRAARDVEEDDEEEERAIRVTPRKPTSSPTKASPRKPPPPATLLNETTPKKTSPKKVAINETTPKKTSMKDRMKPSPRKTRVASPVVEPDDDTSADDRDEGRNGRDEELDKVLNESSSESDDEVELIPAKKEGARKANADEENPKAKAKGDDAEEGGGEKPKKGRPSLLDRPRGDATTRVRKSLGDATTKKGKARVESPSSSDGEEEEQVPKKKAGPKSKVASKAPAKGRKKAVESEDEEEGDAMDIDGEEEEPRAGPSTRGRRASLVGKSTTAKPASKSATTAKPASKSKTTTKPASKGAITVKPASKSKPASKVAVLVKPAVRAKGRPVHIPSDDEDEDAMDVDDKRPRIRPSSPLSQPPSSQTQSPGRSSSPTSSAPSETDDDGVHGGGGRRRRNAATKASQKLHDELMPDLMHFEEQLKKSKKGTKGKGRTSDYFVVEGDTPAAVSSKRKKGAVEPEGEEDEEDGEKKDKGAGKKRRKSAGGKKDDAENDGEDENEEERDEEEKRGKKKRRVSDTKAKEKAAEVEETKRDIVILATQVKFDERTTRGMVALGAKFTDKPSHCTHLVANGLVRTEKFLCALTRAPFIVSEDWVKESVKAKKVLPEDNYSLHDPVGEKKYGVTLETALERARTSQGTLLKGKTFYITSKVAVGPQLIRSLIVALGGTFQAATPTPRIIQNDPDKRAVISGPEDTRIWRPIAEAGYPVYSQELILMGALRQEIGWDDETFRLDLGKK
ncbi:hypothetical protein BKA70DRAFT_439614 [Coprinopsis sp. MPI-PUGE-AT-0042]|nr:hypothetical protein BKA70DRAFT_439614 [Coprinopsis sp. MPI-PUGE-AT-0042]